MTDSTVQAGRVAWIDICKALGIFLVLIGHTLRDVEGVVVIYSFHMPLFFFLSGLVFNKDKYDTLTFFKSRFNSLILPYVFFYLVTLAYFIVCESRFRSLDLTVWQQFAGMLIGSQMNEWMSHNGILWFLPCLFVVESLFFIISKIKNVKMESLVVCVLVAIGFAIKNPLPWCISIAMVATQFFFIGNLCKKLLFNKTQVLMGGGKLLMAFALVALFAISVTIWPNMVNMATCKYGEIWKFELESYLGIFSLVFLSICLSSIFRARRLEWIGKNTITIFALHQPLLRILRFVGGKLFTSFPIETNYAVAVSTDLCILFLLLPVIWCYNSFNKKILSKLYIK